jgi:NTP pyrophosphatase (non-canonical NTP hydrolase)
MTDDEFRSGVMADGTRLMQPAFDYAAEAFLTVSSQYHGELVAKFRFVRALNDAIDALQRMDAIKKALFYGRDAGLGDYHGAAPGQYDEPGKPLDMSNVPNRITDNSDLTNEEAEFYIHGVIGVATEAGELLENLRDAISGKGFDRTNIGEEVGDAKWYMALLARVGRFKWGDDEMANIAKLRMRFPDRFTEHDANNRQLAAERDLLEHHLPIGHRTAKMEGERNLDGNAIEAQRPNPISSAELIAKLDDPNVASVINEKGSGRHA